MRKILKKFIRRIINSLNILIPKKEKVFVRGVPNNSSNAVAITNYIDDHYNYRVYYSITNSYKDFPQINRSDKITILKNFEGVLNRFKQYYHLLTSKYIFFTHKISYLKYSKRQIAVNVWHGVMYKKVGVPVDGIPAPAEITVGTSEMTGPMFAKAFGVPKSTVFISGYPRNDIMLNARGKKSQILSKMGNDFGRFENYIIWLPTYRQRRSGDKRLDGKEAGNPFYIPNFDVHGFNELLKANNTCCMVKPHPMAIKYSEGETFSNLFFIDDKWISDRGLVLYDLVGITNLLISDVSSIVIDYLLLGRPIACVSIDLDEYEQARGFCFENIRDWLPNLFEDEEGFINYVDKILSGGKDEYSEKRRFLKEKFFTYHDNKSTERLVEHVFGHLRR